MGFFKKLFGVSAEAKQPTEEEKRNEEAKNFDILKYDGVKAMRMQRIDYAVECFVHALQIKEDLEVRDYLSQCYVGQGELNLAYRHLEKIAEARPDNIAVLLRMANVAFMMEDYVVMGAACEKALLVDKDSPEALYLYAKAARGTNDASNAVAMLTKALSVKDSFPEAMLLRGEVLTENDSLDEADEDAMALLAQFPDNEDILMLKATIERKRGNAKEAAEFYTKVIDANPFNAEAYKHRSKMNATLGNTTEADEDQKQFESLSAESAGHQENIEEKTKEAYDNINPLGL